MPPALDDLRTDLLAALSACHAAAVRDAFACTSTGCFENVRAGFMPLFLDPVLPLGKGVSSTATSLASRYVAAYIKKGLVVDRAVPAGLWPRAPRADRVGGVRATRGGQAGGGSGIEYVGAIFARETVEPSRLETLRMIPTTG